MHDLFAASLAVEGAFDGFDLAPDAVHARRSLCFSRTVCVMQPYSICPHPI
jgi:hypothetical protein